MHAYDKPVDSGYMRLNRPVRKIPQYSLFVPPDFAKALFLFSLGTIVIPKRNWKQCLCKIWGHKQRVLWYFPNWPIHDFSFELGIETISMLMIFSVMLCYIHLHQKRTILCSKAFHQ